MWNFFGITPRKSLGIDIGTFSIKIIELSKTKKVKLENYGEGKSQTNLINLPKNKDERSFSLSLEKSSQIITQVLQEANIVTKKVVFSLPDFASFFTTFYLPPMTEKELGPAVEYEAKEHIPVPLTKVTLDWEIIKGQVVKPRSKIRSPIKILLVAAPNQIVNQYSQIANQCGLETVGLEVEETALSRALIKNEDKERVVCIFDIGTTSSTINIINKGVLEESYSFDISGDKFTEVIAKYFKVSYNEAESLKQKLGLNSQYQIKNLLFPLIASVLSQVEKIFKDFERTEGKKVEKIILAGGSALLPDLAKQVSDYFNLKYGVEMANPFSDIIYPSVLKRVILKSGPRYSIAVGDALRGLEE